jgi:hypothetical protein
LTSFVCPLRKINKEISTVAKKERVSQAISGNDNPMLNCELSKNPAAIRSKERINRWKEY